VREHQGEGERDRPEHERAPGDVDVGHVRDGCAENRT
jgi:hypothetical protein